MFYYVNAARGLLFRCGCWFIIRPLSSYIFKTSQIERLQLSPPLCLSTSDSRHRIIFLFQICSVMHDGPCAEFTEFTLPFWEMGQTVPWALFQPGSFYVCLQSPWRNDVTLWVNYSCRPGQDAMFSLPVVSSVVFFPFHKSVLCMTG